MKARSYWCFSPGPRTLIVAVWLAFSGWFIFKEAFPHGLFTPRAGYDAMIADGLMHRDSWMQILDGERVIGYSNTRLDIDEFTPGGRYLLFNETVADIPLFGSVHRTAINSRIVLDGERQLDEFVFVVKTPEQTMRLHGRHVGDRVFTINAEGPFPVATLRLTLPRDALILPPTAEIALRRLRPGRKMTLEVFDPLTFRSTAMTVEALRRESRLHDGQPVPVTVLAIDYQGMTLHSWVDDHGTIIRQETPLGWILQACEPDEALEFIRSERPDEPAETINPTQEPHAA